MDTIPYYDLIGTQVKRIFAVEDFTLGTSQQNYVVRYRGRLVAQDSSQAYDQLAESLKPISLTPLFRVENGQQIILIEKTPPPVKPAKTTLNWIMLVLTILSVITSGGLSQIENMPGNILQAALLILKEGWPFAVSLMSILLAHEMGHYLVARAYGYSVSLPYFIPLPFTQLGTMGAVIFAKERYKNRRITFDMAAAGPLAGLLASVVVLVIGLSLSNLDRIPSVVSQGRLFQIEGNSIFYLFVKYLRFGKLLPQPLDYGEVAPWLYWLKYFFTGKPYPMGGLDVMIHPVAWAGWVGLLITSLNLIPAGQLDGGHIFSMLFSVERARKIWPVIIVILAGLGFLWSGWWLWAGIIFMVGRLYAQPLDEITQLDRPRRLLGVLILIILVLIFTPIPLVLIGPSA